MAVGQATQPVKREWLWTLISGCITLLLAILAFFLPDIEWAPKGGMVGWLLLVAGLAELAFGWRRGLDPVGEAAVGSGLVTAGAGILFVLNPLAGYFSVANVAMVWLFLRGAWVLAMALRVTGQTVAAWLAVSGITDMLLGIALFSDLPVSALVYILFGPTPALVARFALILAASFFVTAISQIGIALSDRHRTSVPREA